MGVKTGEEKESAGPSGRRLRSLRAGWARKGDQRPVRGGGYKMNSADLTDVPRPRRKAPLRRIRRCLRQATYSRGIGIELRTFPLRRFDGRPS